MTRGPQTLLKHKMSRDGTPQAVQGSVTAEMLAMGRRARFTLSALRALHKREDIETLQGEVRKLR